MATKRIDRIDARGGNFCDLIKEVRADKLGWSQAQFAQRLGIKPQHLGRIERGDITLRIPRDSLLLGLLTEKLSLTEREAVGIPGSPFLDSSDFALVQSALKAHRRLRQLELF